MLLLLLFCRASTFAYLRENHNSVLGMREYALEAGEGTNAAAFNEVVVTWGYIRAYGWGSERHVSSCFAQHHTSVQATVCDVMNFRPLHYVPHKATRMCTSTASLLMRMSV